MKLTTENTEGTEVKKNDGGPAFPSAGLVTPAGIAFEGMSLRDWFAGQALAGLLASGHFTIPHQEEEGDGAWLTTHEFPWDENGQETNPGARKFDFAEAAWRCAGAMLRERNREIWHQL